MSKASASASSFASASASMDSSWTKITRISGWKFDVNSCAIISDTEARKCASLFEKSVYLESMNMYVPLAGVTGEKGCAGSSHRCDGEKYVYDSFNRPVMVLCTNQALATCTSDFGTGVLCKGCHLFYRTADGFIAAGLTKVKCSGHFDEDKALVREEADVSAVKEKSAKEAEIESQPASKAVPRKQPILHLVDNASAVEKLSSDVSELKGLMVQLLKGNKSTAGVLSAASKVVKANTPSPEVNDSLPQYRSVGACDDSGCRKSRSRSPRRRSRSDSRSVSPDESHRWSGDVKDHSLCWDVKTWPKRIFPRSAAAQVEKQYSPRKWPNVLTLRAVIAAQQRRCLLCQNVECYEMWAQYRLLVDQLNDQFVDAADRYHWLLFGAIKDKSHVFRTDKPLQPHLYVTITDELVGQNLRRGWGPEGIELSGRQVRRTTE